MRKSDQDLLKVNLILDHVFPEFNASMTVMKSQQTCSSEQRQWTSQETDCVRKQKMTWSHCLKWQKRLDNKTGWCRFLLTEAHPFSECCRISRDSLPKNTSQVTFAFFIALSEFGSTENVFVNAYLWLFPGGVGDLYDPIRGKTSLQTWANHLLKYHDGQFLKDQLFCLYVYNTIQRHKNNSEGKFFSTTSTG